MVQFQQTVQTSSPVPPPEVLAEYAKLYPNSAKFFFGLVEREQAHRHRGDRVNQYITIGGMVSGFVLGALAIGAAAYLGMRDKVGYGSGVFLGGAGTLIAAVVWGRRQLSKSPKTPPPQA